MSWLKHPWVTLVHAHDHVWLDRADYPLAVRMAACRTLWDAAIAVHVAGWPARTAPENYVGR